MLNKDQHTETASVGGRNVLVSGFASRTVLVVIKRAI